MDTTRYDINRKDMRRRRKRIFLCGLCAIPRRPLRFLDHKLNLFSDETPMMPRASQQTDENLKGVGGCSGQRIELVVIY